MNTGVRNSAQPTLSGYPVGGCVGPCCQCDAGRRRSRLAWGRDHPEAGWERLAALQIGSVEAGGFHGLAVRCAGRETGRAAVALVLCRLSLGPLGTQRIACTGIRVVPARGELGVHALAFNHAGRRCLRAQRLAFCRGTAIVVVTAAACIERERQNREENQRTKSDFSDHANLRWRRLGRHSILFPAPPSVHDEA